MDTYVVKPGDSLSKIASRILGSPSKWRLLAELNQMASPSLLAVGQTLKIPSIPTEAPLIVNAESGVSTPEVESVRIAVEGKTVFAIREEDGQWIRIGKLHKKGLYRLGSEEPEDFIRGSSGSLTALNLTSSEINVMLATAENEGNLDAINTWDNHFLSFGMFQWTAGGANARGELAALLYRVKQEFPDTFQHYWGRYELDVAEADDSTGWLRLKGKVIKSAAEKTVLRDHVWAYRFSQAGADKHIKAIEVAHAVGRLEQFYYRASSKLGGFSLSELITSEFGVALLLDNHVNRPGYVFGCVATAIDQCGMVPADLAQANRSDEKKVLAKYLEVRQHYGRHPMTDAMHRGMVTQRYVTQRVISDKRGSFEYNREH